MAWLLLSVVLMTIAFHPWLAGLPVLLCLVPAIHVAMKQERFRSRLFMGVVWGVLIFCFNFYWVVQTMHTYGRMGYGLSVVLFLPLAVVQTLPFSVWFVLFPYLYRRHPVLPVIVFPILVRLLPMVFPYSLASALSVNPLLVQTASIWGEWGLDALVVGINVLIWMSFQQNPWKYRIIAGGVTSVLLIWGGAVLLMPDDTGPVVRTAVIQPCVLDGDPIPVKEQNFFGAIREARGNVDGSLVVIPESSLPDTLVGRPDFFDGVEEIRRFLDARAILVNAVVFRDGRLTNSQFLMTAGGSLDQYDKNRLMLFGERFPFYDLFQKLPIYAANFANFSPGKEVRPMEGDGLRIATPICLEAIFEDYVARLSRDAGMIINPTDDEWFGVFHATWLHFSQVRLKTVENRRWLVRAANTGYSVVVDEKGRIRRDIPHDKPGRMVADIPQLSGVTVYQRLARWMSWIFGVVFVLVYFGGPCWRSRS